MDRNPYAPSSGQMNVHYANDQGTLNPINKETEVPPLFASRFPL